MSDNTIKKHSFIQSGFNLSTDYNLLWNLIFNENKRIPAWTLYTDKYDEPIWDLVEVKKAYKTTSNEYFIGFRGACYSAQYTLEDFIALCESLHLHFILPN